MNTGIRFRIDPVSDKQARLTWLSSKDPPALFKISGTTATHSSVERDEGLAEKCTSITLIATGNKLVGSMKALIYSSDNDEKTMKLVGRVDLSIQAAKTENP